MAFNLQVVNNKLIQEAFFFYQNGISNDLIINYFLMKRISQDFFATSLSQLF